MATTPPVEPAFQIVQVIMPTGVAPGGVIQFSVNGKIYQIPAPANVAPAQPFYAKIAAPLAPDLPAKSLVEKFHNRTTSAPTAATTDKPTDKPGKPTAPRKPVARKKQAPKTQPEKSYSFHNSPKILVNTVVVNAGTVVSGRKGQAPASYLRTTATDDSSASSNVHELSQCDKSRVALWNTVYRRKVCGNSAPLARNLEKYLANHLECEVYCGQDKFPVTSQGASRLDRREAAPNKQPLLKRVTLWHKVQNRKVVGNAAPLEKNVAAYLLKHPEFEIYDASGDEREKMVHKTVQRVLSSIVSSVAAMNKHLQPDQSRSSNAKKRTRNVNAPNANASHRRPKKSRIAVSGDESAEQSSLEMLLEAASKPKGFKISKPKAFKISKPKADQSSLEMLLEATDQTRGPMPPLLLESVPGVPKKAPVSPPFSPLCGPEDMESDALQMLHELSLPPPAMKASASHRLLSEALLCLSGESEDSETES